MLYYVHNDKHTTSWNKELAVGGLSFLGALVCLLLIRGVRYVLRSKAATGSSRSV